MLSQRLVSLGRIKLPEMFGSKSSNRLVEGIADGLLSLDS